MGDLFKNLSAHPFAKLNHSLLVTGRAEVSALARKCQKIFMAALCTSDPGKAVAQKIGKKHMGSDLNIGVPSEG